MARMSLTFLRASLAPVFPVIEECVGRLNQHVSDYQRRLELLQSSSADARPCDIPWPKRAIRCLAVLIAGLGCLLLFVLLILKPVSNYFGCVRSDVRSGRRLVNFCTCSVSFGCLFFFCCAV